MKPRYAKVTIKCSACDTDLDFNGSAWNCPACEAWWHTKTPADGAAADYWCDVDGYAHPFTTSPLVA